MKLPLVSIIVPLYNAESYIGECIESLINQTYSNLEIIVIDDGSTDNSKQVLSPYMEKDVRIRYYHQENSGPSKARNEGLKFALGKYIAFIDSDDYISLVTIENCIIEMNKNNPDVILFNGQLFFPSGEKALFWDEKITKNIPSYSSNILETDKIAFFTNACTCFYKKSFLDSNNIRFVDGIIYEDLEFQYHVLSKINNYSWINKTFYFYRRWIKSSITSLSNKQTLDILTAFELAKIKLEKEKRWYFFEYAILLNTIRHTYSKFSRDVMILGDKSTKIQFFYSFKKFLNNIDPAYLSSISNNLGFLAQIDLFWIRRLDFSHYRLRYFFTQYPTNKSIHTFKKLGIRSEIELIEVNLKQILRAGFNIGKSLLKVCLKTVKYSFLRKNV